MGFWESFNEERKKSISCMHEDKVIADLGLKFMKDTDKYKYSYNFTWMGAPVIQFPQDIIAMQEIIWRVKPDVIIETGVAHGGSLIFYASMLRLLEGERKVIGVDIDIREHNRVEMEKHPLFETIHLIEGSSVDREVLDTVKGNIKPGDNVLVALDSNHTHEHVLKELELYSPFVTGGSYLVVFDTIIEDMPESFYRDRPWSKGNNPKTAVKEFLKTNDRFIIDKDIDRKLLITVAPDGYLKCIK